VIRSLLLALAPISAPAQSNDAVWAVAQREKQPLLDTLKALVEIESGTADVEGVTRILPEDRQTRSQTARRYAQGEGEGEASL
jgi:hypothetical protein